LPLTATPPMLASSWKKIALLAPALTVATAASAFGAEAGVAPQATVVKHIGGFPVTNSMVTTWFFSIILILVIRWAVGRPKLIPSRGQVVVETVISGLKDICEPIVGKQMIDKVFPLLISFFIFILIMNWSGLLPGAGTIGIVHDNNGTISYETLFRPADSDLNTTLALAIVSFVAWLYFVLRYAGIGTLISHTFGNKANKKDVHIVLYFLLSPVFFLVGFIEVISILSRLLSLPFRLYGNVFGGENLLDSMYHICPFLLPVPFYALEMMVGVIQAFVFTLLTAVYIGLVCNHDDAEHDHAEAGHEAHSESKAAH
jgi:F-type H+-transporting ATPase subunit a